VAGAFTSQFSLNVVNNTFFLAGKTKEDDTLEMDPELARYLDRSFWEKKQQKAEAAEEPKKAARKSEPTSILSSHAKRFDPEPAAPQASAPPIVTTAPMTNSTAVSRPILTGCNLDGGKLVFKF
jgi:hypothetical protein